MSRLGPGEGLIETMRLEYGVVARLERHLARMATSARALGLDPDVSWVRDAVTRVARDNPAAVRRVRAVHGARELTAVPLGAPPAPSAATVPGAWDPRDRIREHKTTRRRPYDAAADVARAAGAGHALMLDAEGNLGETAIANIVCLTGGRALTPPVAGILPGVARAVLVESGAVAVAPLGPELWRGAEEIVAVNSLRGAMPITTVDGQRVGTGRPGRLAALVEEALAGG